MSRQPPALWNQRRDSGEVVLVQVSPCWAASVNWCIRVWLTCLQRGGERNKPRTAQPVRLSTAYSKEDFWEHVQDYAVTSFAFSLVDRGLIVYYGLILLFSVLTGKIPFNRKGHKIRLVSLLSFPFSICFPTCVYTGLPSCRSSDTCSRKFNPFFLFLTDTVLKLKECQYC